MDSQKKVYAIYTSKDNDLIQSLLRHLKPLEEDGSAMIWHDDPIHSGRPWKPKNESRLNQADIFLLFVSNAFMHSEFIQQLEFKKVIDRYKAGSATVIPILLDECPWDIDFNSDDYDFNFKELQVLPEGANPVSNWDITEQAIKHVADRVTWVISPATKNTDQGESNKKQEKKVAEAKTEDQLAIPFSEEQEAKLKAEQAAKIREEAEAKRKTEAENKQKEEAETKQRELTEKRLKEQAEAKRKAEEQKKQKEEIETKRRTQEEQRLRQETEAKKIAEEANRLREEAEIRRKAENKKRLEAENIRKEEEAKHRIEKALQAKHTTQTDTEFEESGKDQKPNTKKRLRIGAVVALLAILGVIAFSIFNNSADEDLNPIEENNTVEKSEDDASGQSDALPSNEVEIEASATEDLFSSLNIGERHEGGIVFSVDSVNKKGKIAHVDDAGPMPWQDAMIIHDQLGDGWRLPTLEELQLMYKNIGQGADNSGEFAGGLYWSATDYDQYQARLLRFRDGNTSYHYNKEVENRRFLVRAVRDFGR